MKMSAYQDALIESAQDFHNHEMNVGGDSRWERWHDKVCGILVLPLARGLDGDQDEDGYCMDFAYDAFRAGVSATEYAETVRYRQQFRAN
jgi:hypothetical protein